MDLIDIESSSYTPLHAPGGCCGGFWGSWGTLGPLFGDLGVALGVHFERLGVPLGAFGAQSPPKTPALNSSRAILGDFGAQEVPRRLPKGLNIDSKVDRNSG